MEVQFWIDSKTKIEADGLYTPYRILADIPDPFNIAIFNDLTNQEVILSSLSKEDQNSVSDELNLRAKEYLSWSDAMNRRLYEALELDELNEVRGIK